MRIGIIGGAGVAATNKLNELIEVELTKKGAFRDSHHPEIIIWQATKTPSRSMYLEGRGESFIDDYVRIAQNLKYCGCDTICMCCNTAHYAIDEISQKADVKIINLIELVVRKVKELGVNSIGLMASDGCLKGMVYEKYINKICPNIKIIYPNTEFQKKVTTGICNVKNIHRFDENSNKLNPKTLFIDVAKHLKDNNAEIIIAGCTDIRVVYEEADVDSLLVLKDAICNIEGVQEF